MRIFVSYTTKDAVIDENLLNWISNLLTSCGRPFVDLLHNDSPDRQFRVERELYSADILLLLESSSVKDSRWVLWELQQAQNLDIPIIRIRVDNYINYEQIRNNIKYGLALAAN